VNIVSAIVLIFFLIKPQILKYFFESILGRILFLLFITTITYCNSLLGILFMVVLIGLYNSKVFEGMTNASDSNKKVITPTTQSVKPSNILSTTPKSSTPISEKKATPAPIHTPVTVTAPVTAPIPLVTSSKKIPPLPLKMSLKPQVQVSKPKPVEGFQDRARMLSSEDNIRSKNSNNLTNFDKSYFKSNHISPSYSGMENFQSSPASF
jgi:hypothetical protein